MLQGLGMAGLMGMQFDPYEQVRRQQLAMQQGCGGGSNSTNCTPPKAERAERDSEEHDRKLLLLED